MLRMITSGKGTVGGFPDSGFVFVKVTARSETLSGCCLVFLETKAGD